jgi:hypothetical protein
MWKCLTFDIRGAQKAQPFGHPLDGRVRATLIKPLLLTNSNDGMAVS